MAENKTPSKRTASVWDDPRAADMLIRLGLLQAGNRLQNDEPPLTMDKYKSLLPDLPPAQKPQAKPPR